MKPYIKTATNTRTTMEFLMTQNLAGAMLNVNHALTSIQPTLPRRLGSKAAGRLNLSIVGLGTQYPPYELEANVLDTLAKRHYPKTSAYVCTSMY